MNAKKTTLKTLSIQNCEIFIGNIEESIFQSLLSNTYKYAKKVIIVDENTHDACLEYFLTVFPELETAEIMLLPVGEENKVLEVCFQVWEALSEYKISRKDLIINLGGGVVTDMGGFIASVFKRGIDFINVPTSLLGMVDASIGGKNGIDLGPYKNQLGVFNQANYIFADTRFLSTLPEEELLYGFAEMLKHALISDKKYWQLLSLIHPKEFSKTANVADFITEAMEIKVGIVSQDLEEKNIRKSLNFGHTVGHALEGYCLQTEQPLPHGHAVALGIIAESYISFKKNLISERELMEITSCIVSKFPYVAFSSDAKLEVIELMKNDKKNHLDEILFVLLKGIGNAIFDQAIDSDLIMKSLNYIDAAYSGN